MKSITKTAELMTFLRELASSRAPGRLTLPKRSTVFGCVVELTPSRILRFEVADGVEGPRPGASVQLTGVHRGGAFGFVADYLGRDETAWLLTTPFRVELRQRRVLPRFSPLPGMLLRLAVGGRHYAADLVDLSECGLGFSTADLPFELRPGARLEGRLDLRHNRFVSVQLEVAHMNGAFAGARILSMPEPARRELETLRLRSEKTREEVTLR